MDLQKTPLGIPMTLASVGTLATLFVGKNLHAGFGVAWAAMTLWHGWQHHQKMQADAQKLIGCCKAGEDKAVEPLQALMDSFQVDAYVPGRVRLRSTLLAAYPEWAKDLEAYIRSFTGVETAVINTLTGSLLITYDAAKLRQKPKLAELEQRIAGLAANK